MDNDNNTTNQHICGELLSFKDLFSIKALNKTWKNIKKELLLLISKDAINWLDWATTIDRTLPIIQNEILKGEYAPSTITRFECAKSQGSFRVLTLLNIRDVLVYRHISDYALNCAIPKKVKGAYFSRRHSATPVGKTWGIGDDPYLFFWDIWLRYNEYRSYTLLNEPHHYLVVTDISNYFESIQHDLLFEYLSPLGIPREAVGLLGKLLEAFRPWTGHSRSPMLGLPVDEFDCSRQLAHIFLFEHDKRIADKFGENNYVRWIDDQNIGVNNLSEARSVINHFTRSLSQQRLTINSGKTRFLKPEDVVLHFQLDANKYIKDWEEAFQKNKQKPSKKLVLDFYSIWNKINKGKSVGIGNWEKILKRIYGHAAKLNLNIMEKRALDDLITYPTLSDRIFVYLSIRNKGKLLLEIYNEYLRRGENFYEDVEVLFFENLLNLNASKQLENKLCDLSFEFVNERLAGSTERPLGRASALMCLFWFGAKTFNILSLFNSEEAKYLPKEVARTWLATLASLDPKMFNIAISRLFGHPSDDVARLARFIMDVQGNKVEKLRNYRHQKKVVAFSW